MKRSIEGFYAFLATPIAFPARFVLAALVLPLALSFFVPLWSISMTAPQYPHGLSLDIYLHKVEGGRNGADIAEINTLNHYIGMAPIDREQLSDLGWLPFAIGLLAVVALRCAVIGNVRILVDLFVIASYLSVFAFGRFVYRLYVLGHVLDPRAPMHVDAFTPAILGTKKIANFTITSLPEPAAILIAAFVGGVGVVLLWELWRGWRDAGRAEAPRAAAASTA